MILVGPVIRTRLPGVMLALRDQVTGGSVPYEPRRRASLHRDLATLCAVLDGMGRRPISSPHNWYKYSLWCEPRC